jgi:hypothetical protein
LSTNHYLRATDGQPESRLIEPGIGIDLKNGTEVQVSARSIFDNVPAEFPVAGATVPAGAYWYHEGYARLGLPRSARLRGEFTATAGSLYDGTRASVAVNPVWNPSKYLELGAGYQLSRIVFDDRGQATTAHLARLRVAVALSTKLFFNALAQHSNVAHLATFNARFRYNLREGTDLWLVYNEGFNTVREVADLPRLPVSSGRTLLVKYTHTLIW